ncbi:hypothetical protein [Microbacterium elymi]|uniref:Uncharacterized protein n=1 Tax=Microbacterium elymi TaxID=2909587 RepID=A0ABY5NM84_9MICO|nr:hypothetical protein [Microbacterium elymi]UUT36257.1 hypothetical protein L2X98_25075 [Microbacterium elymi]
MGADAPAAGRLDERDLQFVQEQTEIVDGRAMPPAPRDRRLSRASSRASGVSSVIIAR